MFRKGTVVRGKGLAGFFTLTIRSRGSAILAGLNSVCPDKTGYYGALLKFDEDNPARNGELFSDQLANSAAVRPEAKRARVTS